MTERNTEQAARAFAKYYKAERDRCEKCIEHILSIVCGTDPVQTQVEEITARLEVHFARSENFGGHGECASDSKENPNVKE